MLKKILPRVARAVIAANRVVAVAPSRAVALQRSTPALSAVQRRWQSDDANSGSRGTSSSSSANVVSPDDPDFDPDIDFHVDESIELPVKVHGIHGRYASALYLAASENEAVTDVRDEFEGFIASMDERDDIRDELLNPTIATSEKLRTFSELAKDIGLNETLAGFFAVLIENGRMAEYTDIFNIYEELVKADEGIVDAKIVLAEERSDEDVEKIASIINDKYIEKWQSLQYDVEIDPSIIGGFKVYYEDNLIDLSIASRIDEVKTAVVEGGDDYEEEDEDEEEYDDEEYDDEEQAGEESEGHKIQA